jgi:hypothetical protein
MQFVTVEVCAMRTLPAASTVECQSAIANPVATNKPANSTRTHDARPFLGIIAPNDAGWNAPARSTRRLGGKDVVAHRR